MQCMPIVERTAVWTGITGSGTTLVALGLGSLLIASKSSWSWTFNFVDDHINLILLTLAAGGLLVITGLVGRAFTLEAKGRAAMGVKVILSAIATVLVVAMIDDNVHATLPIAFLAMIPIFILGLIVLVTAAFSRSR